MTTMQPGTRVTWNYRTPGGYGFVIPVAGVIQKIEGARATITIAHRIGGQWTKVTRNVKASKLSPRTKFVPEVDEERQAA